jgi:hypothetical protein
VAALAGHNEYSMPELPELWEVRGSSRYPQYCGYAQSHGALLIGDKDKCWSFPRFEKKLGFPNAFGLNPDVLSGGLIMMWKSEVFLDMWVTEFNDDKRTWRFTSFCRDPKGSQCKESWCMLHFLWNESDIPWLCAGEFNEIFLIMNNSTTVIERSG